MLGRYYGSEGIVLSAKDYGEADKIVQIFTRERGKIFVIAKGVRRPKSRKSGAIQVFSQIRFSTVRGHGMEIITEARLLQRFEEWRACLTCISVAYFFVELVMRVSYDEDKNEEVYALLLLSLKRLSYKENLKKERYVFVEKMLAMLGFWPENVPMVDHDLALSRVIERQMNSVRVGKRVLR